MAGLKEGSLLFCLPCRSIDVVVVVDVLDDEVHVDVQSQMRIQCLALVLRCTDSQLVA
jgi:hypothetical protein